MNIRCAIGPEKFSANLYLQSYARFKKVLDNMGADREYYMHVRDEIRLERQTQQEQHEINSNDSDKESDKESKDD